MDVGNTNVTLGVFDGEILRATWRLSTDSRRTDDEYALFMDGLLRSRGIDASSVDGVSLCSTVPPVTNVMRRALRRLSHADPMIVGRGTRTGIRINYDRPQDVGTDRIVDAVAAVAAYGAPAIVVDFGTATVFDAVSPEGDYLGGAVAPGVLLAAEALYQGTSQLRRVELLAPETAIGRNTVAAIQSGLMYGYVSLVEGMVGRFKRELISNGIAEKAIQVVATGGLATVVAPETEVFTAVDEDLTLKGLRILYEMNR